MHRPRLRLPDHTRRRPRASSTMILLHRRRCRPIMHRPRRTRRRRLPMPLHRDAPYRRRPRSIFPPLRTRRMGPKRPPRRHHRRRIQYHHLHRIDRRPPRVNAARPPGRHTPSLTPPPTPHRKLAPMPVTRPPLHRPAPIPRRLHDRPAPPNPRGHPRPIARILPFPFPVVVEPQPERCEDISTMPVCSMWAFPWCQIRRRYRRDHILGRVVRCR